MEKDRKVLTPLSHPLSSQKIKKLPSKGARNTAKSVTGAITLLVDSERTRRDPAPEEQEKMRWETREPHESAQEGQGNQLRENLHFCHAHGEVKGAFCGDRPAQGLFLFSGITCRYPFLVL